MNIEYRKITFSDKHLIELIANWYFDEWSIDKKITIDRIANFKDTGTPFQFIMTIDGMPIATGGVYDHVGLLNALPRLKTFQPWLALVYTIPEFRGKGYGAMLCQQIQWHAKHIGLKNLFLFTHTAETLYKRLGWQQMERVDMKGKDIVIMQKDL